jgi:TRAP-type C4-dicarboxylate transport system permease small subunit
MDLIVVVLIAALIGFLVWVITTRIPMPPVWANAIQVFALVALVLFLLSRVVSIPNVLR